MSMTREVYERGQIVIPKYIRDLFGWTRGTKLDFVVENEAVVIKKATYVADEFAEMVKGGKDLGEINCDEIYERAFRKEMKRKGYHVH